MNILRNLPIAEYHASDRVSHSKLKTLAEGGPRLYYLRHIQKSLPMKRSEELVFGDFFETLFQRPASFAVECPIAPLDASDGRTTKGKAFKASMEGKDFITMKEFAIMQQMVEAATEHPLANALIAAADQQVTLVGDVDGIECQARPDWLNLEGIPESGFRPYSVDLKTTKSLGPGFMKDLFNYGYHSQAAMADSVLGAPLANYLYVVEKEIPHRTALMQISDRSKEAGEHWIRNRLQELMICREQREYPRCVPGVVVVDPPRWMGGVE